MKKEMRRNRREEKRKRCYKCLYPVIGKLEVGGVDELRVPDAKAEIPVAALRRRRVGTYLGGVEGRHTVILVTDSTVQYSAFSLFFA